MFTRNKLFLTVLILISIAFVLVGCGTSSDSGQSEGEKEKPNDSSEVKKKPIVTITMEDDQKIVIELEPSTAPNTVANFISLVEKGYYNGLIFHRVIPGFMIQGGDPSGNGSGGPGYSIKGEFASNGFKNDMKHERGVISMARTTDPNSAGSQFFIMVDKAQNLDGEYAAFGKVTEGMETVDAIVAAERDHADKPLKDQQMEKVEVETFDFDYPSPDVEK